MTKQEYEKLVGEVRRFNEAYEAGDPEITDYEYDRLMLQLKEAEKLHPAWRGADSPTQVAGAPVRRTAGVTVRHDVPMLSIEDVFERDDVISWVHEVRSRHPDAVFSVEQKIDGLSMSLRYENGALLLAETRGDGYIGEDVTLNARVIPDVVPELKTMRGSLEVRGEVYMSHEDFDAVNRTQEMLGRKTFANPRNCAAGTLRQLDPEATRERGLSFMVFNVQRSDDPELTVSHIKGLTALRDLEGIRIVPARLCTTDEEILLAIDEIGMNRGELDYDIDGAVVKIDQVAYRQDFPAGSKYSAGHIAYKYPPEEKESVIRDIEISVGMTGRVNPTAVFDPIRLCGTTVTRATLHNQDFINKLHIGIGDTVVVYKSGEIIPKIRCSVPEKRPEGTADFVLPAVCPSCGSPLVREADAADVRCINPDCPAQLKRHLIHFVSRDAMDIKGLGTELLSTLADEGYLTGIADIYSLKQHRDELIEKGLIGREKNTDKLLLAIEESKQNEPARLLTGLAIPNVGKTSARTILNSFGSFDELMGADEERLMEVPDIGGVTASQIRSFFSDERNRELIERLRASGLRMEAEKRERSDALTGKTYVITGSMEHFPNRDALAAFIEERGGKLAGSVSRKTTALINNDAASQSGKNKKARELGIPILTEEEFLHACQDP